MDPGMVKTPWLFSKTTDLAVFLGSAAASVALLAVGWKLGLLDADSPEWTWIAAVLLIDVAHVWSTSFRVYFDAEEFRRRVWLYTLVPVCGYLVGVALHSEGELVFWRTLAVVAVFHFIRQQYGWVALYRRKLGETDRTGAIVDGAAVYLATVYPIVFWMTGLPREFAWFVQGDFQRLPVAVERLLFPVYVAALLVYFSRTVYRYLNEGFVNPGKDIVVATTAICWYTGIVWLNSDYAFTVTNVIIHGVPYFALVYAYSRMRRGTSGTAYRALTSNWVFFLATLWAFAYVEELFWDRGVWHEREWLFGTGIDTGPWKKYLVPLLAVPQITHYVLDGFIWRRRSNDGLSALI